MALRKWIAVSICVALVAALAACGSGGGKDTSSDAGVGKQGGQGEQQSDNAAKSDEPVTLSIYHGPIALQTQGVQTDPVAKELEKKFNVKIDIVNPDDNKLKLMMASREMSDIMIVFDKDYKQLIEGDLILPLDDLLESHGKDIAKAVPDALDYYRKNVSAGKGKLYFLPTHSGLSVEMAAKTPSSSYGVGYLVRWDYYKELGYPQLKSTDDVLQMLKQMQEKHPTTADGKKVYGISMFVEQAWGVWPFYVQMAFANGYVDTTANYLLDTNGKVTNYLADEDGPFWNSMKYYFKANQMGLLDPESFTQKSDQYANKLTNLQVLSNMAEWWNVGANDALAAAGKDDGFVLVPLENSYVYKNSLSPLGRVGRAIAISKNSKHPEKAMELLNYLYTYEGMRLIDSGIKGKDWDVVDGKPEMKDDVIAQSKQSAAEFQDKTGIGKYAHSSGLDANVVDPDDGMPVNLFQTPKLFASNLKPYQKQYAEHFGGSYPGDAIEKMAEQGKLKIAVYDTTGRAGLGTPPDDIKRIDDGMNDYLMKALPKLILAKSEADFEAEKSKAISELNKLGLDKSMAYWDQAWKDSFARYKK